MALRKNVLKPLDVFRRCSRHYQVRNKSITGYQRADDALQTVTGGRINRWLDAYEDFVGLSEVRQAQEQVTTVTLLCHLIVCLSVRPSVCPSVTKFVPSFFLKN